MSKKGLWPKAIFYDSKTTLFDWGIKWIEASKRILEHYGSSINPEEFKKTWNMFHTIENHRGAFGQYKEFQTNNQTALMNTFNYYKIPGSPDDVKYMADLWKEVQPFPDVVSELKKQKEITKVIICSNIETVYLQMMVEKLGDAQPDFLGDMQKAQASKPSPRAYYWVLNQVGLEVKDVIYCARPQWDVQGAIALGMKSIWLNRGNEELQGVRPDHEAKDMYEVTSIIKDYIRL